MLWEKKNFCLIVVCSASITVFPVTNRFLLWFSRSRLVLLVRVGQKYSSAKLETNRRFISSGKGEYRS